jgi:hypothetical protein
MISRIDMYRLHWFQCLYSPDNNHQQLTLHDNRENDDITERFLLDHNE